MHDPSFRHARRPRGRDLVGRADREFCAGHESSPSLVQIQETITIIIILVVRSLGNLGQRLRGLVVAALVDSPVLANNLHRRTRVVVDLARNQRISQTINHVMLFRLYINEDTDDISREYRCLHANSHLDNGVDAVAGGRCAARFAGGVCAARTPQIRRRIR